METDRLSNSQFAEVLGKLIDGRRLPPGLPPEDAADLTLAKRMNDMRWFTSRLVIGDLRRQKEIVQLMGDLKWLRPVERQVLAFHLGGGYSLPIVAQITQRSETNTISCLRTGLRTLRRVMERRDSRPS